MASKKHIFYTSSLSFASIHNVGTWCDYTLINCLLFTMVCKITRCTRDRQPLPSLKELRAHKDGSMGKVEISHKSHTLISLLKGNSKSILLTTESRELDVCVLVSVRGVYSTTRIQSKYVLTWCKVRARLVITLLCYPPHHILPFMTGKWQVIPTCLRVTLDCLIWEKRHLLFGKEPSLKRPLLHNNKLIFPLPCPKFLVI